MSKNFIALILAAGAASFAYYKIGRGMGYSNSGRVWAVAGSVFVVCYIILIITFTWLVHF